MESSGGGRRAPGEGRSGEVEVRVRYAETDQMGRAYHTHYLVWCEVGRTGLLAEAGYSYGDLERRGTFLPVSRAEVEYHGAARYEDRIRVTTRVERLRSRSVTFRYALHRLPGERLLAEARTTLVCVDADGRLRRLPAEVRTSLRVDGGRPGAEEA